MARVRVDDGPLKFFFKNLLLYRMSNRPTLTTVLRRMGEFNTSLIARLKLPKKSIITRSRNEKKNGEKTVLNPKLGPLPGRVNSCHRVTFICRKKIFTQWNMKVVLPADTTFVQINRISTSGVMCVWKRL